MIFSSYHSKSLIYIEVLLICRSGSSLNNRHRMKSRKIKDMSLFKINADYLYDIMD